MALYAAAVAVWAALAVPVGPPLSRKRQTVADLARRLTGRSFLALTATLAAATAAGLSAAVPPGLAGVLLAAGLLLPLTLRPARHAWGQRRQVGKGSMIAVQGLLASWMS
ncbi:hypothetical protein [Streptomyces sp. NPDC001930]|uniref:hypothetical protein n=1 Tax=Streptomyces sp. NPDC001930 TaxID=3364625 RepID=UPI0036C379AC